LEERFSIEDQIDKLANGINRPKPAKKPKTPLTKEQLAARLAGRERGRANREALTDYQNPNQVLTVKQVAALEGTSEITLLRKIKANKGPRTIRLNARRIGIRVCDYIEWQEARMREAV
jgi:predicted DNA-binding transcriptional regulator AlpA